MFWIVFVHAFHVMLLWCWSYNFSVGRIFSVVEADGSSLLCVLLGLLVAPHICIEHLARLCRQDCMDRIHGAVAFMGRKLKGFLAVSDISLPLLKVKAL